MTTCYHLDTLTPRQSRNFLYCFLFWSPEVHTQFFSYENLRIRSFNTSHSVCYYFLHFSSCPTIRLFPDNYLRLFWTWWSKSSPPPKIFYPVRLFSFSLRIKFTDNSTVLEFFKICSNAFRFRGTPSVHPSSFLPKMRVLLLRPSHVNLPIGEFLTTGELLLLHLPRIGELHFIASPMSSVPIDRGVCRDRGYSSTVLSKDRGVTYHRVAHPFLFRHPSRNSDKDDTDILPSLLLFCAYSRREMHPFPNKSELIPCYRTCPTWPCYCCSCLLSLMFTSHRLWTSVPPSPKYLPCYPRRTIYILNRTARPPPCFASIFPFCSFKTDCGLIYKPTFIDLHSPPCLNTLRYFSSFAMPICY